MKTIDLAGWLIGIAALSFGCGDDDSDGTDGGSATTNAATSLATGDNATSNATSDAATLSTGNDGSGGQTTATGAATTDASTGAGSGGPVACADVTCEAGELCVHPCGGGQAPGCEPALPGGRCPAGFVPDNAGFCRNPCGADGCCAPEPEDLTPFCLAESEFVCAGGFCDGPRCVAGEITGSDLICGCPP